MGSLQLFFTTVGVLLFLIYISTVALNVITDNQQDNQLDSNVTNEEIELVNFVFNRFTGSTPDKQMIINAINDFNKEQK